MILSQCCALQKVYGKTNNEIETLVEGFNLIIGEKESLDDIKTAFMQYMRENSDIPAPSDIVKILKLIRHKKGIITL